MPFAKEYRLYTINVMLFVGVVAGASMFIAQWSVVARHGISPLIVGIVFGIIYGNTLRDRLPAECDPGLIFSAKGLLRVAIVLYGFRITYQEILAVGLPGLIVSAVMLSVTMVLGTWLGIKLFRLDKETAMLNASGGAVCGAAAVLATESVLKSEPYKGAIAVSAVVLFGTVSMLVYPVLYGLGVFNMDPGTFGIYVGASVHEVAQVVAIGDAVGPEAAENAVIVKMTRVMLLAPMLIILGIYCRRTALQSGGGQGGVPFVLPWFAIGFLICVGIHSLHIIPGLVVEALIAVDTFLLTMAMVALGMETNLAKVKHAGLKPLYHAGLMFVWLVLGGYFVTIWVTRLFG